MAISLNATRVRYMGIITSHYTMKFPLLLVIDASARLMISLLLGCRRIYRMWLGNIAVVR